MTYYADDSITLRNRWLDARRHAVRRTIYGFR